MANSNMNSRDSTKAVQSFLKFFVEVDWWVGYLDLFLEPCSFRPNQEGALCTARDVPILVPAMCWRGAATQPRGTLVRTHARTRMCTSAALPGAGRSGFYGRHVPPGSSRVAASAVLQTGFSSYVSKLLYFISSEYLCWLNRM